MSVFGLVISRAVLFRVALAVGLAGAGIATVPGRCERSAAVAPAPGVTPAVPEDREPRRPLRGLLRRIAIPVEDRVANWGPSCGWAVTCTLLNDAGQREMSRWVREHREGGVSLEYVAADLNSKGYRTRFITDVSEVEIAIAEGKPVGYRCPPAHAVTLVGLDASQARYIDPNYPRREIVLSRSEFELQWNEGGRNGLVIDQRVKSREAMR